MNDVLAMDLEIGDQFADFKEWRDHRPLSITCVGLSYWSHVDTGDGIEKSTGSIWSDILLPDGVAATIDQKLASETARVMYAWILNGGTLVTWNGLAFDLPVLADASGEHDLCKEIALSDQHVDMMFNMFMLLGWPVGLETASIETTGEGKYSGVKGKDAPKLWAEGGHGKVLKYVEQDARMTRDLFVALSSSTDPIIRWRTKGGRGSPRQARGRPDGWSPLWSVDRTLKDVEPPEVASFMTDPLTLKGFLEFWNDD